MLKRRFRLPSPAFVIAVVALFAALGGTSLAATKVIAAKHKDAKADTKLVKKLAPSLSVKHAKTANSATTAANATHATTADSATHATSADSATSATNATNATNATHATNADTATDATTVGGKKVQQFFSSLPTGTASTTIISVDGVTLKGSCDGGNNPHLTIENDSGQGAYLGGYSSSASTNLNNGTFTSTPVDLTGGTNGGGVLTVELANGQVVSVQFAGTGFLGGTGLQCRFGGSIIAS